MRQFNPKSALVLSLLWTGAACSGPLVPSEDAQSGLAGSVDVRWALGGRSCNEAGVATVQASLESPEGEAFGVAQAACQMGTVTMPSISPGLYRLVLRGASRDGMVTHQAALDGTTVKSGETYAPRKLNLRSLGASLDIRWRFHNGELCSFNGVDEIELAVFDDRGHELHLMTYACDESAEILIEDVPAGIVTVIGTGVDAATGEPGFRAQQRVETSFGAELDVALVLEDCTQLGGCL